ncbi:DUF6686 family protein [Mucilaginibacter pallidiroseus]|nr:DUF6686 family protein [Mucilaginibacter pallidiroseus]
MCETKILTRRNTTVISHCPECSMLNIWHQNLMLCFTPEQFVSFQNFTKDLDFDDRNFPFPDGSKRVVLCTPNRDINLVFTEEEWSDFNIAMLEASYLLDAYNLIYSSR